MRIKSYIVGFFGTNCYLVWDDASNEAMLIDPGAHSKQISDEITGKGLCLKYIALTHGHSDHYGGAPGFMTEFPEAQLVCGSADIVLIGDTDKNDSSMFIGKEVALDADLTLRDGDVLTLGNMSFNVLGTPGHSKGSVSLYTKGCDPELAGGRFSGTVFSGDALFRLSIGRTDFYGGDFQELSSSIREKLFRLPNDTLVLPGHMSHTTIEYEAEHNPFV